MHGRQSFSTLDDWLAWFETLHPKKIDMSLNRIRQVLDALGLGTPPYRVVTIGGTNGKGSCVAYLERIYSEAGYRVGAFTSPHLWKFNERIAVDGIRASDDELIALFEAMDEARGPVTLTYFENSAVAAFLHFARRAVDVALLEVGMGGRLDAVNVYDADAALIASIALDHEQWLGGDRELIGREKAGIVRPGRPVIVGDPDPPESIEQAAREAGAEPFFVGRDFFAVPARTGLAYSDTVGRSISLPAPRFGGEEQLYNAAACVKLVESLQALLPVSEHAIRKGIGTAETRGRLERRMIDGVEWVFDVAHNPAAADRFLAYLAALPAASRTTAVFGAMGDKDLASVLEPFTGSVDSWFVAPVESDRTASVEELDARLRALGADEVSHHGDIATACRAAREAAFAGERVLVFGSFYTVGPAMVALGLYSDSTRGE